MNWTPSLSIGNSSNILEIREFIENIFYKLAPQVSSLQATILESRNLLRKAFLVGVLAMSPVETVKGGEYDGWSLSHYKAGDRSQNDKTPCIAAKLVDLCALH